MGQIFTCELENRRLLRIGSGAAEEFLQGILTCNLDSVSRDNPGFGGLLTPQGKILFDFIVLRDGGDFLLDVDGDQIDELVRRLTFYRLRADVSFEICTDGTKIFACWRDGGQLSKAEVNVDGITITDPRLDDMGLRTYSKQAPSELNTANIEQFRAHQIELGIPEGGIDYQYGEFFPHEALYDQTGGVDFSKGCYVGQEVVSRMHHRGTARKRIIQISGDNPLPEAGSKVTISDKSVGEITSVAGNKGLALLRLDRVGQAIGNNLEMMAGGIVITPQIQTWASFSWPGDKQAV